MSPELKQEKCQRLRIGWDKLRELRSAEPAGDAGAQERAAATHVTTTTGISRPLADRYLAQAARLMQELGLVDAPAQLFSDEVLTKISDLDDKFGASFMVLPEHVDQILKGGKHMSRRFRRWGDEGDVFRVKGKAFRFFRVSRLKVGDITEDDIRKEGYKTVEDFHQMWIKSHPKSVASGKTLDPGDLCWCHEYEPA